MAEWKIIHIDETDSTNRWLRECPRNAALSMGELPIADSQRPIVVVADYQTAGRGCGSNTWESERGKNLLYSMLIHPTDVPVSRQFLVSMAVANSIAKVVSRYVEDVSIKWPNDIYVRDQKLCGMLIENRLKGSVIKDSIIGIGLNVNQLCFKSDAPNPVSLANLTGRMYDMEALLQKLLAVFDAEWADLDGVRSRYLSQLYRRKGFHRYRDASGEFSAELMTVEDDGHLVLRDVDGRTNWYAFKEVRFV